MRVDRVLGQVCAQTRPPWARHKSARHFTNAHNGHSSRRPITRYGRAIWRLIACRKSTQLVANCRITNARTAWKSVRQLRRQHRHVRTYEDSLTIWRRRTLRAARAFGDPQRCRGDPPSRTPSNNPSCREQKRRVVMWPRGGIQPRAPGYRDSRSERKRLATATTTLRCAGGATELQAYPFDDFVRRRRNNCGPEDFAVIPITQAQGACLRHQYSSRLYCNALLEIELFVAQAGADYVSADDSQTEFAKLTADERTRIADYVRSSVALWESRIVPQTISNSRCGTVTGYLVDPDGMKDHPTYSGSHWTSTNPNVATAWDLSHARRFVRFLDTMYRNVSLSQPTIPQAQIRAGLANMLACKVWAADNSLRFANFIDGSNPGITLSGTYYAPWSMSHSYMGGGFAAWARDNAMLSSVNTSTSRVRLRVLEGRGHCRFQR
jgi:hypothetical protein